MLQKIKLLTFTENYINTFLLLKLPIPQHPMTTEVKKLPLISPSYFQSIHNNKFKGILPSQLIYMQATFFKQTFPGHIEA